MGYSALIAVLTAYGADQGSATNSFAGTAKKAAAVTAGGIGTTRFYGRDGASTGRTDASQNTTRFYGHDRSLVGFPSRVVR